MTPEIRELQDRGKQLIQQAYSRKDRTIHQAKLNLGDVSIKHDTGVFSIIVHYGGKDHLVYVETPSGEFIGAPDRESDPAAVLHGLVTLRQHMVLDDLAEIE